MLISGSAGPSDVWSTGKTDISGRPDGCMTLLATKSWPVGVLPNRLANPNHPPHSANGRLRRFSQDLGVRHMIQEWARHLTSLVSFHNFPFAPSPSSSDTVRLRVFLTQALKLSDQAFGVHLQSAIHGTLSPALFTRPGPLSFAPNFLPRTLAPSSWLA